VLKLTDVVDPRALQSFIQNECQENSIDEQEGEEARKEASDILSAVTVHCCPCTEQMLTLLALFLRKQKVN
jgi:hypothetical protein